MKQKTVLLSGVPFVCVFSSQRGLSLFSKCSNLYCEYVEQGIPPTKIEIDIGEYENDSTDIKTFQTVFSPEEIMFKKSKTEFNERIAYTWGQMFATDLVNETIVSEDEIPPIEIIGIAYNYETKMRMGIFGKHKLSLIDIDNDKRILRNWVNNSTECIHRLSTEARIRLEQWGYLSAFWSGVRDMLDIHIE